MKVLIYTDNVSNNHLLYYALGRVLGKDSVFFVNSVELLQGTLTADVDLFVMPGGASRYKSAKLDGEGSQIIKHYVENGGRYLGICAGAYMGCEQTHWAPGEQHEIVTANELAFFPGRAVGPVSQFGRGDNYNATQARVVKLNYEGKCVDSLYMGGCTFVPESHEGYEVVATFTDVPEQPAAIVRGEFGNGRWLLCSTHPEFDNEAISMLDFDVVGNQYAEFSAIRPQANLSLSLFEELLQQLIY